MESPNKKPNFAAKLIERLHEPLSLRVALCVALLAVWYQLGYTPMSNRITVTTANLERDRKRLALATAIEALRAEEATFIDRLPPRSDPNEFLQYVLGGVRSGPLKLVSLTPEKPKEAGPFEVASVKIELEGKYKDVAAFLHWVETDKRLLRIDSLAISPDTRDHESLKVQLNVLGLMGVEATAKSEKKAGPPASKSKSTASKAANPARKKAKG